MLENSAFYSALVLLCMCVHIQIGLSFLSTCKRCSAAHRILIPDFGSSESQRPMESEAASSLESPAFLNGYHNKEAALSYQTN